VVDETLANSTNRSNEQGEKEGTRRERGLKCKPKGPKSKPKEHWLALPS